MSDEAKAAALIKAALDVAADRGAHAFLAPVPKTTPQLYVALGEAAQISRLIEVMLGGGARDAAAEAERERVIEECALLGRVHTISAHRQ
jgi:hypothetical protein